jgi:DNA ligase-associated metallophosphoesterase
VTSALAHADAPETSPLIHFRGHVFVPLASGALYWPAENTLLVADLHLEKHVSFARRGQLLPPYDTAMTLRRLAADLDATGADTMLALGDSFHRDEATAMLLEADRAALAALTARAAWIWLSGNHDPRPHRLGGRCLAHFAHRGLVFTHEPGRGGQGIVAGHLHPAARVLVGGRTTRRPCFVNDGRTMLLPAYGASAGAINILSRAFAGLFDHAALDVVMLGRGRVYAVHPRTLVAG